MSKLKSLAKLRQFAKGQDVEEYLFGQHRQNLLALEQTINSVTESTDLYMTLDSISAPVSSETTINFLEDYKIDPSGIEASGVFYIKEDKTVNVNFSIKDVSIIGAQDVSLIAYINSRSVYECVLINSTSASNLSIPLFLEFPLSLRAGNKLSFVVSVGAGSNPVTIESGVFKMSKLNI